MRTPHGVTPAIMVVTFLFGGCYSTSKIAGDASADGGTDTASDTAVDPGMDTSVDPGVDTATDSPPWDSPPDVATDTMPACPPGSGTTAAWTVDDETFPPDMELHLDCIVVWMAYADDGSTIIGLSCPGPDGTVTEHRVTVFADPPVWIPLWEGAPVYFEYVADPVWWVNRWFRIGQPDGMTLIAGVDATSLTPWGTPSDRWFDPLDVSVVGGLCPPEPDWCGNVERQGLEITYGTSTAFILDGDTGYPGDLLGYQVNVAEATHYVDMDCDDVPDSWYSVLFAMLLEG